MAYKYLAAGYLVENGKVLLVHHRKFNKWTPPGGHVEEDETPDQAVVRELKEELSLDVEVLPAHKSAFGKGEIRDTVPVLMPFHIDLEREGFRTPHVGYFFYVKFSGKKKAIKIEERELIEAKWFSKAELLKINTFDQVRAVAKYAIDHYPKL